VRGLQHAQRQPAAPPHPHLHPHQLATAAAATPTSSLTGRAVQQQASLRDPVVAGGSASGGNALHAGRQRLQEERAAQVARQVRGLTMPREAAAGARVGQTQMAHSRCRETGRAGNQRAPLIVPAVLVVGGAKGRSGSGGRHVRQQQQPTGVMRQGLRGVQLMDRTGRTLERGLGPRQSQTTGP
jgi:hypothetical protein